MDEFEQTKYAEVLQRYKAGANWFYWIAGLTIINSLIAVFGGGWRFLISLGATQMIDAIAEGLSTELGGAPKVVAFVLDMVVTGTFVIFGYLAHQKYIWGYVIGMVVFLLDGLLTLIIQDWIGLIAHVVILFFLFRGYQAGRELESLKKAMAETPPETPPQPTGTV